MQPLMPTLRQQLLMVPPESVAILDRAVADLNGAAGSDARA